MKSIRTRDVIAYMTLPRVLPRVKNFFSSGFAYVAFLMAQIYYMVRLLPVGHPYLNPANMGRFGLHHVIAEAARNLTFSKKNIDQIIVFGFLLMAVVMLVVQFILLLFALLGGSAFAFSFFDVANPQNDVAFNILDQVFGVPDMFCSSYFAPSAGTCPITNPSLSYASVATMTPFQIALHELFRFYSEGLLLIGLFILLYFIVVIVLETAVSGSPFGQRFQNVWVPIRLVVAVSLLVPLNQGLNSGQYITLYAAKYGSNFASNGWRDFNLAIGQHGLFALSPGFNTVEGGNPIGEPYSLLAMPSRVDVSPVVQAMTLVHACAYAYALMGAVDTISAVPPKYSLSNDYTSQSPPVRNFRVKPYLVKNPVTWMTGPVTFPVATNADARLDITSAASPSVAQAVGFYFGGDIIIRFGEWQGIGGAAPVDGNDLGFYAKEMGGVRPLCGDIRVPVTDLKHITDYGTVGGPDYMLATYYEMVLRMWFDSTWSKYFVRRYVTLALKNDATMGALCSAGAGVIGPASTMGFPSAANCKTQYPTSEWKSEMTQSIWQPWLDGEVKSAWGLYLLNGTDMYMENNIIERGWGGAGIWFNKLAEVNGSFMDSVLNLPGTDKFPLVMEQVRSAKLRTDSNLTGLEQFKPSMRAMSNTDMANLQIEEGTPGLQQVAAPLFEVFKYLNGDTQNQNKEEKITYTNIFMDAMNLLMGTSGIANIRGANAHLHPLAQLVAVGKGLVEAAIRNVAVSSASAFLGGALVAMDSSSKAGALANAASSLLLSTAFIGLTAGIVLFYVLPFLPFLYFFFAVASWVKAIFEAMVGVPLWALAHLRIDGEGLPGDAAQNGYFLLLDIFIRPILTVVGLVAAITVFGAQARVLNLIWDLVTENATGFSGAGNDLFTSYVIEGDTEYKRSVVDQFFFTVIYTVIMYMLATASFKLIDKIPDNILRWAGVGVSTFGDIDQENVDSISRYASMGGMTVGQQAAGAVQGLAEGTGSTLGTLLKGSK
ncbi:MAG: DotA/TraY family protein [Alphaproteobacteria bacterium]|nr:DotA/TraY family protein [Alphaproteobacteria bacterium]